MGVINITPNSFSDGGELSSLTETTLKINSLLNKGCHFLDVGAESTAPFNSEISEREEIARFDKFLVPLFSNTDLWKSTILSVDTYRLNTFKYIYAKFPGENIVWNDVSGIFDDSIASFLIDDCPNADYVFCHNNSPTRELTSGHMDYAKSDADTDIAKELEYFFSKGIKLFKKHGIENRIILDPCFGFSKTLKQNLILLGKVPDLMKKFPSFPFLIGVSRKSFFKYLGGDILLDREIYHLAFLRQLIETTSAQRTIVRLHDPVVLELAKRLVPLPK